MGVEARCEQRLGRDFSLSSLMSEGFDLVAFCSGGYDSRKLLPGGPAPLASVPGLHLMIDLLAAGEAAAADLKVGRKVVIVDGLNRALAMARQCLAAGADEVCIASGRPFTHWPEELQDAEALAAEAIHLHPEHVVAALGGRGDRLTTLVLEDVGSEDPAAPGRLHHDVDTLILGIGRLPELVFQRVDLPLADAPDAPQPGEGPLWQTIETFRTLPFSGGNGIFSSPEPGRVSDSTAVVKSMLSGRRLVRGLQQHLLQGQVERLPLAVAEAKSVLDVDGVEKVPVSPRQRPSDEVVGIENDWLTLQEIPGLDEAAARREAARCLACGLICYQKEAVEHHG